MLANWLFFWDTNDWVADPGMAVGPHLVCMFEAGMAPCPHVVCMLDASLDGGSGGGGSKKTYQQASPDFWAARERYLRRFVEPAIAPHLATAATEEPSPAPEPAFSGSTPLQDLQDRLQISAARARAAVDEQELRDSAAQLTQLILDIQKIRAQNYARAIHILLLDVF